MYQVKPIFNSEQITLPTCMYHMKNFHGDKNEFNTTNDLLEKKETCADLIMVEEQQEDILRKLNALKETIEGFKKLLKFVPPVATTNNIDVTPLNIEFQNIVVHANPKVPPYGLLAFYYMWKGNLKISNHCHSSLLPQTCPKLVSMFSKDSTVNHKLHITLIWNRVDQLEFSVSPTSHATFQDEVNLLRFLSYIGPDTFNIERLSNEKFVEVNHFLDLVYKITTNVKGGFESKLKSINPTKSGWIMTENTPSIADAYLWSYFKTKSIDPPNNLRNWFNICNNLFA